MLIARFFTIDGDRFDFPLAEGNTLPQLMQTVYMDGYISHAHFFIPYGAIKQVVAYEAAVAPGGPNLKVVPFTSPEKPAS